jgi:catechol 2,3-dioxygenase-like lactoylglutathione lyase family enzyme
VLGGRDVMAFIATRDARRARAFYADVLGLQLMADEPHALVFDANGTMLRIQKVKTTVVLPYTALGWKVPDIRAAVHELRAKGVAFERYDFLEQDEDGIWTAGGDRVAWFKDPDGHTLSITQFGR